MSIYLINLSVLLSLHFIFDRYKRIELEKFTWFIIIFLLTIFIGFRYEIGADWIHYEEFFYDAQNLPLEEYLNASLVYVYINKFAFKLGIQFIGVNFICALIFMFSLSFFLKNSKNRWLALAVSFPIIIVVLGMGYTRQGLAFSFFLFVIRALEEKKLFQSFIFIILSILSHKTALFISSYLIFVFFWYQKQYIYFIASLLIPIFFAILFWDLYKHYLYFYVGFGQHMFSYGSIPRSFLILLVALLFLIYKKKFINMSEYQIFVYTSLSWMIIFLFPFSFTTSIVVDRLLLYLYPLKLLFISSIDLKNKTFKFITFLITAAYSFYFIMWIFFGVNSPSWVPYKFIGFN